MPLPPSPDIRLKLTDAERGRIGQELLTKIIAGRDAMRGMLENTKRWQRLFEGILPAKTFPWEGCSNLCIPTIQSHVDTYHSHVNDVILGVYPTTKISAPAYISEGEVKAAAARVQNAVAHVETEVMNLQEDGDQWNLSALLSPGAVAKVAWREEFRSVTRLQPEIDPITGQPVVDETGMPLPSKPQEVEEVQYRGPRLELVDLDNFVVYPTSFRGVDDVEIIGDRFQASSSEIRRRIKPKTDGRPSLWDKKQAEQILERPESENASSSSTEQRDDLDAMGLDATDADQFWFWEVIAPYDANKDGIKEDCVFTIDAVDGIVVRATRYPYWHGGRCYVIQRPFLKAKRRGFGRCLPQILEGIQFEANAIHNQRIDAVTQAMSKAFKYNKSSGLKPDDIKLFPGATIAMNDTNDVVEFEINPLVPGTDAEQINRDEGERASGINDLTQGRESDANKTLGEIQLVAAKSGVRFADVIRRLQRGYCDVARQVAGLMYQFMEDEELAELGLQSRDELIAPWRYQGHGDTGTADTQRQRQEAMLLYDQMLLKQPNPLIASDLMHVRKLTEDVFQAFDRQDIEDYIGTTEDAQMMMVQQQMAAQQQAQMQQEQQMAAQQGEAEKTGLQRQKMGMDAENAERNRQAQMEMAQMKQMQGGVGTG